MISIEIKCPHCGSTHYKKDGKIFIRGRYWQRYKCWNPDCPNPTKSKSFYDYEIGIDTLADPDNDLIEQNVKLAKQTQRYADINRLERASFRNHARSDNVVLDLTREHIKLLEAFDVSKYTKPHHFCPPQPEGLMQLSDTHFNELVEMDSNTYDFRIASKRLQKFVSQAKRYFKLFGITNIVLALTGDLLNSDRRLTEVMAMATNRCKAQFLAGRLIEHMILDLNEDFNVNVVCVTGNESRIKTDVYWSEMLATENYDYSIFNFLRILFKNAEGINFLEGNPLEQVVGIAGQNVLMVHGNQFKPQGLETQIQKTIGKYSSKGIRVDYIIMGHYHSARIGDTYGRSASLVGANEYSEECLQLVSRASQNVYVFYPNGDRDGIRIDLQNTDGVEGYDIEYELEAYNAKSAAKKSSTRILLVPPNALTSV